MFFEAFILTSLHVTELKEKHDQEIAAAATVDLEGQVSDAMFLACVPRESAPYSKTWASELRDRVFAGEAMGDLMKCGPKRCAFNFLQNELELYEKLKTKEERQNQFIAFYTARTLGQTPIDPERTPYFIRSFDLPFDHCQSDVFKELLDQRPVKRLPYRLSHVRYNSRMRQTTRLLQGTSYPLGGDRNGLCYAEALIFSDHYDLDRIEVWKLERKAGDKPRVELSVSVRHRIDLLNTWFRRLNKGSLREELKGALETQMKEAVECLRTNAQSH